MGLESYQKAEVFYNGLTPLLGSETVRALPVWGVGRPPVRGRAMRREGDTLIASNNGRDLVTWHPDGRVDIYGARGAGDGVVLACAGPAGGFYNWAGVVTFALDKRSYWVQRPESTAYGRNLTMHIIEAGDGVVHLRDVGDSFVIDGWSGVRECLVPRIDRARARQLSQQYRLRDFAAWLRGVLVLDEAAQSDMKARWAACDYAKSTQALKDGNFELAARYMPLCYPAWGGSKWSGRGWEPYVSPSCADKLRAEIYAAFGAVTYEPQTVFTISQYQSYRQKRRIYG